MFTFKFVWKGGSVEIGEGESASDAFRRLGYGGGALAALDYVQKLTTEELEAEMEKVK